MVRDEETLSDHKMLTFRAFATSAPPRLSRCLKDVNWGIFRADVEQAISIRPSDMNIHQKADFLIHSVTEALDIQAPLRASKTSTKPRWWSEEIQAMRAKLDKMHKQKRRRPGHRERLATLQREYKNKIKTARTESFKKFCSSHGSVPELAGMVRALTTKPGFSALISDAGGSAPVTHSQSHDNLLSHHFPSHLAIEPQGEAGGDKW